MKKSFGVLLISLVIVPTYTKAVVCDLKLVMQDRYEKDCAIRDDYDLYEFPSIAKVIKPYVNKNKFVDEQAYVNNTFFLKSVEYRGVPVKKIEIWQSK